MVFGEVVWALCWVSDSENRFPETLGRVFLVSSIRPGITIAKVHFFNERLVGFHLK